MALSFSPKIKVVGEDDDDSLWVEQRFQVWQTLVCIYKHISAYKVKKLHHISIEWHPDCLCLIVQLTVQ